MSSDINAMSAAADQTKHFAIGIGADAQRISADPRLIVDPSIISYNFPGLLGTLEYSVNGVGRPNGGSYADGQPNYTKWSDAITQSDKATSSQALIQAIAEYALQTLKTKGVFASLIPNTRDGYLIASNNFYDTSESIDARDTNLPPEFRHFITPAIDGFNKLYQSTDLNKINLALSGNHENNVLILGPYSNGNIALGDGNNVILNSPAMFEASLNVYQTTNGTAMRPVKSSFYFFYPSAQGSEKTNTILLGNGNNVVYYDSSIKLVQAQNGDNVFAPSFGSFNWARNDLQTQSNYDKYLIPLSNDAAWLTPMPLTRATGNSYSSQDTYSIVTNFKSKIERGDYAQMTFVGGKSGAPNNPVDANGVIDQSKLPSIGGQTFMAGDGNDVFYGADPAFYQYDENSGRGISGDANRTVYRIAETNTKNERFSYQNFETLKMLGGKGNDIFYLGDPTRIQPDGLQYTGNFSYVISTSHRELANQAKRETLAFADTTAGVDIIEVNLSANIKTLTNTAKSFEQSTGENPRGADFAKAAVGGFFGAAKTWFDEYTTLGSAFKYMPIANLGMSAISAVTEMVKIFTPPEPPPIVVESKVMSQPLGQWRQAIAINDWNPGTVINIKVDPTITTAPTNARWSNVVASIGRGTTSNYDGTVVYWEDGNNKTHELFVLEDLGRPKSNAAYHSFNFRTGEYDKITQENLAFIGTIAPGQKGIEPLKNYKAGNGFVFSSSDPSTPSMAPDGSYQFYWNDSESGIDLNAARNSANTLSVQFDSRSLGWYWQPTYTSNLPKDRTDFTEQELKSSISLDENKSKLWVVSPDDPNTWIFHTFADFKTKPFALSDALLANTYYEIKTRSEPKISEDQKTINALVNDLTMLGKIMPDLNKLEQSPTAKIRLDNIGQITGVDKNGKAVDVYFTSNDGTHTVYKTTISNVNGSIKATDPVALKAAEIAALEFNSLRDIDGNDVVGSTAFSVMQMGDTPNTKIAHLYKSILTRAPDSEGLQAWVSAISEGAVKELDVVRSFLVSEEYVSQMVDRDYVSHLYLHLLNRMPDSEGLKSWTAYLANGGSCNAVVDAFVGSPEFSALIGIAPPSV